MPPISADDERGKTSQQMRDAPHGALILVANLRQLGWFRDLAAKLDRADLTFDTLRVIDNPNHLAGKRLPALILDHWAATRLTDGQRTKFEAIRRMVEFEVSLTKQDTAS